MASPLRFQHFEVLTRADGSPHLLGKGAMGLTYKAFDRNLLSFAVVKVMAPEHAGRPEARQRFLQEAQSMARISHPNVADVFFLGESAQGVFYAMEFCDGPSTQEYVEEHGPLNPVDALTLGQQAAEALRAVQRNHLIHRDIKPSNMILVNDAQGRPQAKLIDFGLARDVVTNPDLSQGGFVGTPTFASPEQLLEQEGLDIRSDIYSLGITLWFMLCGRPPFSGSQFEVMFHHVNTPPPWDRLPHMPPAAVALLRRMIEKSPDDRFQTPDELSEAFRTVLAAGGFETPSSGLHFRPRESVGSVLGMSSFEILAESPDSDLTGKVFKARDAHEGRIISLKYLHPALTSKPEVLGKIQRHVLSLRGLQHPHLTGILDFEKSDEGVKIISEWVQGPSLLSLLKARNHLNLAEAAPLLGQLASALDFASSKGLGMVETDLHQVILTSPVFGDDPALWPKILRQPVSSWKDLAVKVNPLRLSPAAQDYPTIQQTPSPELTGGPKPLLGSFLQLAYRLLGGAGGSQSGSTSGFVSIPGLGAEANDLIESYGLPPFTPEKRAATAASVLTGLCSAEGVPVPDIYEPPPEPEEDLMLTRDAALNPSTASGSTFARPGSVGGGAPSTQGSRFARTPTVGPGSHFAGPPPPSGSQFGSQFGFRGPGTVPGSGTRHGSTGGSSAGRISADYEMKRRELELQRQRLESEAERLKQEEVLEATRAMLDEERLALAAARDEFAKQERDRAQRAEQERRKLEEERQRLEAQTSEVDTKRREQERLEQEIRLRAQLEFQKFEEERRQREADWARQREEIERTLKEREEQSLLREQESFRKIRQERERLESMQRSLDEGQARSHSEAEEALRRQVADLESERRSLADQQAELDRRLLTQDQEMAALRAKFEAADREIEERYARLAAEESAAAERRRQELDTERQRLEEERSQLERQRLELAAERQAGSAESQAAQEQRLANEAAMARLAEAEARFTTERQSLEEQHLQRESRLADELAKAKHMLEEERLALAGEVERAREASMAELQAERGSIAATRAQLAAQEAALAVRMEEKARELETQLAHQKQQIEEERAALDAEHRRLTESFAQEKTVWTEEIEARRQQEEAGHLRRMHERAAELGRLETAEQARLAALRQEIAAEETRLQSQKEEVFNQERLIRRMDQEASWQDDEARVQLEAEQQRLEGQRGEIEQKILELHRAQKKRLVTIVAGTLIGTAAAAVAGFYIKGRLIDPAKLKGQEAWVKYEGERKSRFTAQDWPALLHWCVETDERFQKQETDPVIRTYYQSRIGSVRDDARRAVEGILQGIESGATTLPLPEETEKRLRQDLTLVSAWDGLPDERFLLQAKLDLPYLTEQKNPGGALALYSGIVAKNAGFVPRLRKELSVTTQGLLEDFLEDHALEKRDELYDSLRGLPKESKDSVPRIWLLLHLIQAEKMRSAKPDAENYQRALDAINVAATGEITRDFYNADPEWAKILAGEIPRILETLKPHAQMVRGLEDALRETAELWKTDVPYMMLAETDAPTQKKVDFHKAAIRLTGNARAKAIVGGHERQLARQKAAEGDEDGAAKIMAGASKMIREAAAAGEPEGVLLYAEGLRSGIGERKNLAAATKEALRLKELKHPEADYMLGLCYLEESEETGNAALMDQALQALETASKSPGSINTASTWYYLAKIYNAKKDNARMISALESGAKGGDVASLTMLGLCQITGQHTAPNITLGRDNLTKAARAGSAQAVDYLRKNGTKWKASKIPADRSWVEENGDLLQ